MRDDLPRLIRKEALARQGTTLKADRAEYWFDGDQKRARFSQGEEGVVQLALEKRQGLPPAGVKRRIKVFFNPDTTRLERSRFLVKQQLSDSARAIDVLGGAPFAMLEEIGGVSQFALVMKNVEGRSWKDFREDGKGSGAYPPPDWPSLKIRVLWAYALAWAVEQMEMRNFVHADLSDGNLVVQSAGPHAGALALVDFDAYFNPNHHSDYLGTDGFVAPEIRNGGAIGVGSDRFAMAILIQEFLIVGDPDLRNQDPFAARYTQEQICAFACEPHPLLQLRYPVIAGMVDATLKTADREQRPAPALWRKELRSIYDEFSARAFRLKSHQGDLEIRLPVANGGSKNLLDTPFGIRADVVRESSGGLHLRPHAGARVRMRRGDETWVSLVAGTETPLTENVRLYDSEGKLPAQLILEQPITEQPISPNPDAATTLTSDSFHELIAPPLPWKKIAWGALLVLAVILIVLLAWYMLQPAAGRAHVPPTLVHAVDTPLTADLNLAIPPVRLQSHSERSQGHPMLCA